MKWLAKIVLFFTKRLFFTKSSMLDVSLDSKYVSDYRLWNRFCFFYYYFHFESVKFRSSRWQMSFKMGVLKIFSQYSQKILVLESLCHKVTDLWPCSFIKKRLQHKCFPLNIAKLLKVAFFIEHLRYVKKPVTTSPWRAKKAFTKLLWHLYW